MSAQTFVLPIKPEQRREFVESRILPFLLIAHPGKRLKLSADAEKPPRSDLQNRALWGVAYPPIMEAMGLRGEADREEIHEYFCGEYWGWIEYEILGKRKQRPRRTTTKNELGQRDVIGKLLMAEFYNFIQQRAAENGIYVPDPDPMWWKEAA